MVAQGYKNGELVCEFEKATISLDQNGYDIDTLVLDGVSHDVTPPSDPGNPTDVDIARQYAGAYQAALDIIFLLMSRVSTALVIGKHFTPEAVNAEGARFTRYHQAEIEAFKLAGRHPDAGDALYAAVEASAGEFPWLKKEDNILSIFATTLPRNPT